MSDAHHDDHAHGPEHYTRIAGILIALATASWIGPMIGDQFGLRWLTMISAFGIALVKAWLVIKHFMHLNVEKRYVNYMLITALAFMVLFFAGVAPDVMNHRGRQWENVAAQAEVKRALAEAAAGGGHHGDHGGGHDGHEGGSHEHGGHEHGGEHGH
ncbi:MAG: cytochrome C oxidase subunit IV family protein [Myxococcales bacterium]|nr:cytochrome C oxidase subunit IV family protein [Myxococcales bacterium]MDD9965910.1 cytochrome C oxidase subunit IV family protein [Myxococcales bacterium]